MKKTYIQPELLTVKLHTQELMVPVSNEFGDQVGFVKRNQNGEWYSEWY